MKISILPGDFLWIFFPEYATLNKNLRKKVENMKKITIKEVAELACVSTATVSHVINRTRYVSPELIDRVEEILRETGYIDKVAAKKKKLKVGHKSVVVCVVPNIESAIYRDMVSSLRKRASEEGYQFYCGISRENLKEEQQLLDSVISDKRFAGLFLVPVSEQAENYKKLIESGIPYVCMERRIRGESIDSVEFPERDAMDKGANYIIECGHKNILYLRELSERFTREERTRGYLNAFARNNLNVNDVNMTDIDLRWEEEKIQEVIAKEISRVMPTAVIASGNWLTMQLLKTIRNMGIRCPDEISILGFGDETWTGLIEPPLTTLKRDVQGLSELAAEILFEKIEFGYVKTEQRYAEVKLNVQKSTRMLDNGPGGEMAVSPENIVLSKEEKKMLRRGRFRVAISFHYTGTAWAELHEQGIRDELEQYGIEVSSVMDAHFDPALQNVQLESLMIQKPDGVIAIPADDKKTSEMFMKLSRVSKLVFISNLPEDVTKNHYVSCISVNEWENGTNAGRMLGEYFRNKKQGKKIKAGFLNHGAIFYGTRERDMAAERILKEEYPEIEIVTVRNFVQIDNAYRVCREMLEAYPELEALYVSWDRPALLAIKALKEMHREDICVFTTDLDREIAKCMEEGIVKGMSTQRPYEQGRAAALALAKSFVSDMVPKYVGVQPCAVEPEQLKRAWKEIFHEPMSVNN